MANIRRARKIRCIETGEVYNSQSEASRNLGVKQQGIAMVLKGKMNQTGGYHFEYAEVEPESEPEQMYLTITNEQGEPVPVIDSREVARMMGKKHRDIIDYIEGNKNNGIISIAECVVKKGALLSEYFIESSFIADNGTKYKCYLVTKKGCELLGNKQNGEKGTLFSIAYVERFNAMEKELNSKSVHQYPELAKEDELILAVVKGATPLDRATALQEYTALVTDKATAPLKAELEEQQAELTQVTSELNEKTELLDDINDCFPFTEVKQYNKQLLRDRKDIVLSTAELNRVAAKLNMPVPKIDNPIEYSPYKRVNAYPRKVWEKAYPDIKLPEKKESK